MTKEKWITIMRAAGFQPDEMHRWHQEFERMAPDDHQARVSENSGRRDHRHP